MKLAVGIDAIRNNPKLYIGEYEPSEQFLAAGLAGCALTSGAKRVQIELLADGWVSVSAERDWITPSLSERFKDWPLARVVLSLIPQVGGRQNEIRYEVIVSAFSQCLALKCGNTWIIALGDEPPELVRQCLVDAEFAVVFKPQSAPCRVQRTEADASTREVRPRQNNATQRAFPDERSPIARNPLHSHIRPRA